MFNLSTRNEIPALNDFLSYDYSDIQQFCQIHNISSCYLPVDGTRRFFMLHSSTTTTTWNEEVLSNYYALMTDGLITLLKKFYDCGIEVLIVLLMDDSAFARGEKYLKEAIHSGIRPLIDNQKYLDFYDQYHVDVVFAGFGEKYIDHGYASLVHEFAKLHRKDASGIKRQLILYNGSTPSEDYMQLIKRAEQLQKSGIPLTKENIISNIYKTNLKPYDFSIWFGFPRDKVQPPLLWENGVKFYINLPTMELTLEHIKKAIYYTALTKKSIKDEYVGYQIHSNEERARIKNFFANQSDFMGIENYIIEL